MFLSYFKKVYTQKMYMCSHMSIHETTFNKVCLKSQIWPFTESKTNPQQ